MKKQSNKEILFRTGTAGLAVFSVLAASVPAGAQGLRGRRGLPSSTESRSSSPSGSSSRSSDSGAASRASSPAASSVARPGFAERAAGQRSPSGRDGSGGQVRQSPRGALPSSISNGGDRSSVTLPVRPNPLQNGGFTRPQLPQGLSSGWGSNKVFLPGGNVVFLRPGQVIRLNDYGTTLFTGYSTSCTPGYGYVSPFAAYNSPPYIGVSSVLVNAPYLYGNWRETSALPLGIEADTAGADYRARALRAALNDLSRFWEENDGRALRRRIAPDLAVAVFSEERHLYSLRQNDFLALAGDALDRVQTRSFRFTDVRDRNDGLVNAYATHVYYLRGDATESPRVSTLRTTLVFVGGDWVVSAVSLAAGIASR